ncbi:hypothetical protein [Neobacillus niacini]|uniref:hypothetical protein n=1 Tax=Neobacillus niacini TaxID=86668 RepID=UPI00285AC5B5|nr:hypothetical protein [Neobacillus niacini]MDR7002041.1 lysozyme family protein [Neobacillus niacini]
MLKKRIFLGIVLLLLLLASCSKKGNDGTIQDPPKVTPKEPPVEEKVYATPKLSKMLDIIYDFEGGILVDGDGKTNFGVLEDNWIKYVNDKGIDYKPIDKITKADADGYYEYYWKGEDLFKRNDDINLYPYMTYSLALVVFDSKVLDGYGKKDNPAFGSFEILQSVLNKKGYSEKVLGKLLDEDGDFSKKSIEVLKAVPKKEQKEIANDVLDQRDIEHCKASINGMKTGKYDDSSDPIEGWLERVQTLRELIATMNDETGEFNYKGKMDHYKDLEAARNACQDILDK